MNRCILFLSTNVNDETLYRYYKLVNESPDFYDVWFLTEFPDYSRLDVKWFKLQSNDECKKYYDKISYFYEDILNCSDNEFESKYVNGWAKHFNTILHYIDFYKEHQEYEYYWIVEYDVYMKDFNALFDKTDSSDTDLLCSNLIRSSVNCDWYPYEILVKRLNYRNHLFQNLIRNFQFHGIWKCFFTVGRISNTLMRLLYNYYYVNKTLAFFEHFIPTVAKQYNLKIEDLIDYNLYLKGNEYLNTGSNTYNVDELKNIGILTKDNKLTTIENIIIHPIKEDILFKDLLHVDLN